MGIVAAFRKPARLARLYRGRTIRLGDAEYRVRGVITDTSAGLKDAVSDNSLSCVYRSILGCREGAFVDVGANTGQTLLNILAIDRARPYIGFEPQPSCCFLLQSFIGDNDLKFHSIIPVGLSDKDQLVKLYSRGERYDQTASIIKGFRPDQFYKSCRWVSVRKGDGVMAELRVPSLAAIKIDVEGAELEVVVGLLETIRRSRPFLIFEVLNNFLVATGEALNEETRLFRAERLQRLVELLRQERYDIYNVRPEGPVKVQEIKPPVSANLSATNYVAAPPKESDAFIQACRSSVKGTNQKTQVRSA
jgi:FkbM family methyltransferase